MWRTLEDKHTSPEDMRKLAEEEHPGGFVGGLLDPMSLLTRRSLLKGSSIAALAASLQGCLRRPEDIIYPYSKAPEQLIPGIASHFATVTARGRDCLGVLVTSHDGRPTKVEGNGLHRSSFGSTDVRGQLYVWDLYDPDRSQSPARRVGNALVDATADEFDKAFDALLKKHEADQGAGLRLLSPISNSPTFRRLSTKVLERFPKAGLHTYSAVDDDNAREGGRIAYGAPLLPTYNYSSSRVIVSLASDFLGTEPGAVAAARRFAAARQLSSPDAPMTRLYVVESNYTVTGGMADHRHRMSQADVFRFTCALIEQLADAGVAKLVPIATALAGLPTASGTSGIDAEFVGAVANDLMNNRGQSIVVAGGGQPPLVHALALAINDAVGTINGTFVLFPVLGTDDAPSRQSIAELVKDIEQVDSLIILGGNPAYDAPSDLKFAELLRRDGLTSVHLATHRNETSHLSSWHVPQAHELESWGDQQSLDSSLAFQQPLIAPLYDGRSAIELIGKIAGEKSTKGRDLVRETQQADLDSYSKGLVMFGFPADLTSAEQLWRGALQMGFYKQEPKGDLLDIRVEEVVRAAASAPPAKASPQDGFEVRFEPDPALWDGQHANNLWALELPAPMTKLVWDNAALLSPASSKALGVKNGQMLRLAKGDAKIEIPAWIVPGHADGCVTLTLGWGRTAAGRYGNGKGFDVNPMRTVDGMDFTDGVTVEPLREAYNLVQTQTHDRMEGRPIAIDATLDEYKQEPDFASYRSVDPVSTPPLWRQQDYSEGHKWGMAIDLSACTGCNACVVACQAENNIPVVGKFEVERGREMHWLRIDRYFVGEDENNPEVAVQPVTCQQCEEAPCENVCPVNATTHSPEGLNDMAYNRCVGTRYCANNCPYKVRRFNYLDWHGHLDDKFAWYGEFPESRKLQFNPNVTVRMRGVMEKCTYCVQRIQGAKIAIKRDGRQLKDGDIKSACQQACPSQAIAFGDLNDPQSTVSKWSATDRNYKLLAEIGTRPRTTFLARIRNPNPTLKGNG
ncbi:MAG: 4Fe-4S dicluster domain-containing protein [Polyangiales bacterium]